MKRRERQPQAPIAEPEPIVWAWPGRRVFESDVVTALSMLGDTALDDYRSGRLSREMAYEIARRRLRQRDELRRRHQ